MMMSEENVEICMSSAQCSYPVCSGVKKCYSNCIQSRVGPRQYSLRLCMCSSIALIRSVTKQVFNCCDAMTYGVIISNMYTYYARYVTKHRRKCVSYLPSVTPIKCSYHPIVTVTINRLVVGSPVTTNGFSNYHQHCDFLTLALYNQERLDAYARGLYRCLNNKERTFKWTF